MEKNKDKVELYALFHGRVQGVFFRATVARYAEECHILGIVENLSNGSVKLIAQGKKADLERLLEKVKSHPGEADIHSVDVTYREMSTPFQAFCIK